jgi:outer membrane protein assembly factor BamB
MNTSRKESIYMRTINSVAACITAGLLLGALTFSADANDWPGFRGANHDGISTETGWTAAWPEGGPKKLWEAKVGVGLSSVAVANGKVYTMGNKNKDTDWVYGYDAKTGQEIWSYSYPCALDDKYYEGGTHATPTVEGSKVYTVSKHGQVFCLDANTGKVVWSKNAAEEAGAKSPTWGYAGSAFVAGDLLVLNIGAGGLALEKTSGKTVWKSSPVEAGYSTAVPGEFGGQKGVMFLEKESVVAVNLKDGKELWRHPWKTSYEVNAADPILWKNEVFISSGYNKGCCLLSLEGGAPKVVWQSKILRNHFNSCVRVGDYLYGMDGDADKEGALRCVDWKTGAEKWAQTVDATGGLMVADGKLIVLTGKGTILVAAAEPTGFKVLATSKAIAGKYWTVPVLANGLLYCRTTQGGLVCLDLGGGK